MQGMGKKNVFGLQVAVYYTMTFEEYKSMEHLLREAANKLQREAFEIVRLDEFVKIHTKKFSGDAEVTTKVEALCKVDHAVFVLRILLQISFAISFRAILLTHSRSFCKILTSTKAC